MGLRIQSRALRDRNWELLSVVSPMGITQNLEFGDFLRGHQVLQYDINRPDNKNQPVTGQMMPTDFAIHAYRTPLPGVIRWAALAVYTAASAFIGILMLVGAKRSASGKEWSWAVRFRDYKATLLVILFGAVTAIYRDIRSVPCEKTGAWQLLVLNRFSRTQKTLDGR